MGKTEHELERISIRMVKEPPLLSDRPVTDPGSAVDLICGFLQDFDRELMIVVNLKSDGTPINMNVMSVGSLGGTVSQPREALKASILSNAAKAILFHNHPSGSLRPSKEDIATTDRMIRSYEMLGICLVDHIIVGEGGKFYSMLADGIFRVPSTEYCRAVGDLGFPMRGRSGRDRGEER